MHRLTWFCAAVVTALVCVTGSARAGTVYQLSETRAPEHASVVGVKRFTELVRERSDDRLTIDVHDKGELYDEAGALESLRKGGLAFTRTRLEVLAGRTPILNVLSFPYLYRDEEHFLAVINGEVGRALLDELLPEGIVGLAFYDGGSRNFYNRRREVTSPHHMRGLRIAVDQSQTMMGLVASLGAHPSPMAFSDIRSGLLTQLVDGAENSWDVYQESGHWEIAPYYTLDRHNRNLDVLCVSKKVWDELSATDRELLRAAAVDSQQAQRKALRENEQAVRKVMAEAGTVYVAEIRDLDDWRELVEPLYNVIEIGPGRDEYLKRIQDVK